LDLWHMWRSGYVYCHFQSVYKNAGLFWPFWTYSHCLWYVGEKCFWLYGNCESCINWRISIFWGLLNFTYKIPIKLQDDNSYNPYPLDQLVHITYQLCHAVKFLHENQIIHTDLKPENMLFVNSRYDTIWSRRTGIGIKRIRNTEIRLIDFGSAVCDKQNNFGVVSTRPYRAPEVILNLDWNQTCDIWSIGCIVFEMYCGVQLFQGTDDDQEHLAMMDRILGPFPVG